MGFESFFVVVTLLALSALSVSASGNLAFEVHSKFNGRQRMLSALRKHDSRRHGRLLSGIDIQMGGDGRPSGSGLYYAKIGLGTPSKDYYVQVDTGSDILWVNCAGCTTCPKESELAGIDLHAYDPNGSSTRKMATCEPDTVCRYNVTYGDGSSTVGYYVSDQIRLDQMTGDIQPSSTNASVMFGCATKKTGNSGSSFALSGLMGFGQSDISVLSQLAEAGKVKKMFAHCLDNIRGGGIFTIGEVVEPTVRTTALIPNQSHYSISVEAIEVRDVTEQTSTGILNFYEGELDAIIDSGTTLAYLPEEIYDSVMSRIIAKQPDLQLRVVDNQFYCFNFSGNVDDGFPAVKFVFAGSISMTVYPHDYLFESGTGRCFGWMSSKMKYDGRDALLLGDFVLSNKLVVYDLVNQTLGWMDYNCSSSIQVKDKKTGAITHIGAHNLSSSPPVGVIPAWILLIPAFLYSLVL